VRVPFLDYLAQSFPTSGYESYDHIGRTICALDTTTITRKSYDDVEFKMDQVPQVGRRMASIGKELATKRAKMLIYIDIRRTRNQLAPVAWVEEMKRCA